MQTAAPVRPIHEEEPVDRHLVRFYEASEVLVAELHVAVARALQAGDAYLVIATPQHRAAVEERLVADGIDLNRWRTAGRYVALDARAMLERLRVGEAGDADRFDEVIRALVEEVSRPGVGVLAYGEMVALLVADGRPADAFRLELLWNGLLDRTDLRLWCAYPISAFAAVDQESIAAVFREICLSHSSVFPAETYDEQASPAERRLQVALLQHRAAMADRAVDARSRAEALLQRALVAERTARAAAERALAQREEFLDAAAHELRTPLTGILGHLQLLLRRGVPGGEQMQRGVDHVREQAERMRTLIDQLLDARGVEADGLRMERHPVDLLALLADAIAGCTDGGGGVTVTLSGASAAVVGDPSRLRQVVTTLLDTALHASEPGGTVEVTLAGDVASRLATISVQHHGAGIPADSRALVFDRFSQAHRDDSRGSLGLGLFLAREVVLAHGGVLDVEFPGDGGNRFTVSLPLAA